MARCLLVLLTSLCLACSSGGTSDASRAELPSAGPRAEPPSAGPLAAAPAAGSFEALVEIDAAPGYKAFQGVWLVRDDGERWVVAYRPEPWLREFEKQRVRVTGERYTPEGQAIMVPHFRVHTLKRVEGNGQDPAPGADILEVGPEQRLEGVFEDRVGAPGTKLEGEPYRVFAASGGKEFLLANTPEDVKIGQKTTIRARAVELSPYVARRGGPYLWVLEADALKD